MAGSLVVIAALLVGWTVSSATAAGCANRKPAHAKKEKVVGLTLEQASECALATLTATEKESSVVYLDSTEIAAGASVEVGRRTIQAPWDAFLAFVDLEPKANWGHSCRYLLINRATGEIQKFDAAYPPFLKGPAKSLKVIWKARTIPDWAVAVR